jgi:S1-C subfamily serine protease
MSFLYNNAFGKLYILEFVMFVHRAFLALTLIVSTALFGIPTAQPIKENDGAIASNIASEFDVAQYLDKTTVTILATEKHSGSGSFFVSKDGQVWVWTCAHVISALRQTKELAPGVNEVTFADPEVLKYKMENGRKTGEVKLYAEVIRYSAVDAGEDIALLRIRTKDSKSVTSVRFYLDDNIIKLGTDISHCGSWYGLLGVNSIDHGILSQHGRIAANKLFDQVSCMAYPGSSGGPVCLRKDGRYVGMLARTAGPGFHLITPIWRIKEWAKKQNLLFAMDNTLPVPTDEVLHKLPIDDSVIPIIPPTNDSE